MNSSLLLFVPLLALAGCSDPPATPEAAGFRAGLYEVKVSGGLVGFGPANQQRNAQKCLSADIDQWASALVRAHLAAEGGCSMSALEPVAATRRATLSCDVEKGGSEAHYRIVWTATPGADAFDIAGKVQVSIHDHKDHDSGGARSERMLFDDVKVSLTGTRIGDCAA